MKYREKQSWWVQYASLYLQGLSGNFLTKTGDTDKKYLILPQNTYLIQETEIQYDNW